MTDLAISFRDQQSDAKQQSLPLAHLSIEVGHLYMEDFQAGPRRITELFRRAAPWVAVAERICAEETRVRSPRVSTCFLVDDYFTKFGSPADVVPSVLACAEEAGVRIDYVARESACAKAGDIALAELVVALLVTDPPPGSDGSRPTPHDSGWLCNGVRTPSRSLQEAMAPETAWRPPSENGAHRHSVFTDVELWKDEPERQWSCPFLAAIWQLLRLGVLRNDGRAIVSPELCASGYPDRWDQLPPIVKVNPAAAPFAAYRTFSALSSQFMPIEHAVRTILGQVAIDDAISGELHRRSANEGLAMADDLVSRIEYAFTGLAWRDEPHTRSFEGVHQ